MAPCVAPEIPEGLSPLAAEFWGRYAEPVASAGRLSAVDVPSFVILAEMWAVIQSSLADIRKRGTVVSGARNGEPVSNHYWRALRDAEAAYSRLARQFGMTPESRARNNWGEREEGTPTLADIMNG
ncbi:P27 family phage terminase small subunit [Streptomyces sp. HUAS TT7]|uniref:P27 family phage terminase small subunit n=1 Tax=Streptomyces sp. HUAS TT7 TaxID=3447507 RepID=UPI003F65B15C